MRERPASRPPGGEGNWFGYKYCTRSRGKRGGGTRSNEINNTWPGAYIREGAEKDACIYCCGQEILEREWGAGEGVGDGIFKWERNLIRI